MLVVSRTRLGRVGNALALAAVLMLSVSASQAQEAKKDGAGKITIEVKPAQPTKAPPADPPPASKGSEPSKGDAADGEKNAKPTSTGGYSWSDKPRKRRRRVRRRKIDPDTPIATYPGFRMHRDGTSSVWVHLSRNVDVETRQAKGRVTVVMKGAYVRWYNNLHSLRTQHFNTPLSRARLRRAKDAALLVLDLRESADVKATIVPGPKGTAMLRITLPKAKRDYQKTPVSQPRSRRGDTLRTRGRARSRGYGRYRGRRPGPSN